ncbi:MAG: PatB family C-S lyase [Gammaproteobacteria bacterium]|nr:PatB family C-S lyase [Gammaproteobacteria bacterium]
MNRNSSVESPFDLVVSRDNTNSTKWDLYKGQDILPFWVADMDFPIADCIQEALAERLRHPLFGYSAAPVGLFDAIQKHLFTEYDWVIERDWVVYLPGVVAGLSASCRAFAKPGQEIVVNPPIYHHFYDSHENDHQLTRVPLKIEHGRWTYDVTAMERCFSERTRLLMMCTPHNPTGTVFTQKELESVAALCKKHQVLMISDEIHCDLVLDEQARHIPTAKACPDYADHMVTLMSGSKTWNLAGLNCSFAIIQNPELRAQFQTALQSTVPNVPPLANTATESAYRDGQAWRQELLHYLRGNLELIKQEIAQIPGMRLEPLQATYLAWIDCAGLELEHAQSYFEQHGVGFSSGEQFGQPHYVRMNFACPRQILQEGLKRVRAAVAAL